MCIKNQSGWNLLPNHFLLFEVPSVLQIFNILFACKHMFLKLKLEYNTKQGGEPELL